MSGGGGSSVGGAGNMTQAIAQAAAVAARLAASAGNTCEEQVRIPDCLMSAFYGRGSNDTISHIQGDSGCKVQMGQAEGDRSCYNIKRLSRIRDQRSRSYATIIQS